MRAMRYRWIAMVPAIAFALFWCQDASAQRFQQVFGGPSCVEVGRGGVVQLRNGGYIAVGESESTGAGGTCGPSHVYVVCTDAAGNLVWSNIYVIGTSDSALDVIECCNGDIAICGVTDNASGCNPGRDAFLLRLTSGGAVLATATYGQGSTDEIAWNLVEAVTGDNITTNPGDLIVAGAATSNTGIGRDGWIFRTTAALVSIWSQQYWLGNNQDDYLYGVYECRVNVPAGMAGDIVATGGTNSAGTGSYDIWVLRVDGNNGNLGPAPRNSATYGGPNNDEGRAIIELRFGSNPGDLVVTGISDSRPGPSTSTEVAMLQTTFDPCTFKAGTYAGDNGTGADGGMDLKEDAFPPIPGGTVIVTGFTAFGGAGIIAPNVFLCRFVCGSMMPFSNAMAYGGVGVDWGWSVNNCRRNAFCNNETRGYVVAGFTQSGNLIGADPQQLYLIKTDQALSSNCNEVAFGFNFVFVQWQQTCMPPQQMMLPPWCLATASPTAVSWFNSLCYSPFRAGRRDGGGNDGAVSGAGVPASPTIPFVEGRVTTYPNPVEIGVPLNLKIEVRNTSKAEISVSDILGNVVYRETVTVAPDGTPLTVPTDSWVQGSYIVRVDIGASTSSTRVVLTE